MVSVGEGREGVGYMILSFFILVMAKQDDQTEVGEEEEGEGEGDEVGDEEDEDIIHRHAPHAFQSEDEAEEEFPVHEVEEEFPVHIRYKIKPGPPRKNIHSTNRTLL